MPHRWADALSALGFRLVEGEVDTAVNVAPESTTADVASAAAVRLAVPEDIRHCALPPVRCSPPAGFVHRGTIAPIVGDSMRLDRKAVLGTFDHQCLLVLNNRGQPEGFVSLRDIGGREMRIGLLAAFPGVSGRGIGTRLMTAAIAECRRQGMQRLRVATQISNIAALRLYQRQGAVIESTAYWLYRGRHDSI